MSDEYNWKSKPKFQLASMAQTRAGSKALRQILGFVVALAGYNPTPVEEMTGEEFKTSHTTQYTSQPTTNGNGNGYKVTDKQISFIKKLLTEKGYSESQLCKKYEVADLTELTGEQASTIIGNLMKLPKKDVEPTVNPDDIPDNLGTE